MIDRTKKLPARFYVSRTGRKPVREWILELSEIDRYTNREGHSKGRISDGRSDVHIARR
jgi:hypothetical protein